MFKKFFLAFFILTFFSKAQIFLTNSETAFENQYHFDAKIIKAKEIKKITFDILDKKDFEVAVDKNLVETYEFNSDGNITRYYYTDIVKTNEKKILIDKKKKSYKTIMQFVYDTISFSYFYNEKKLVLKRYHDGTNYYESYYYRYDSLKNLTKELRFKETNTSNDKSIFILGNQVLLSEDSFQYQKFNSTQLKCTFLNNENRPYKQKIINFDNKGRKTTVFEHYIAASWIMQKNTFQYIGDQMVSAIFEGNANNILILKNTFEYDAKQHLYSQKQYKNDILLREINYINDKLTLLLNSFIIRDHLNKTIRIVKIKYDYGIIVKNGG